MDRDKKVFLCVKSLVNISMDLKEEYEDFSHMILFIADSISAKEQAKSQNETIQVHGEGKIHQLGTDEELFGQESCDDDSCELVSEDMKIEKEIDEMIETVRSEMSNVSD